MVFMAGANGVPSPDESPALSRGYIARWGRWGGDPFGPGSGRRQANQPPRLKDMCSNKEAEHELAKLGKLDLKHDLHTDCGLSIRQIRQSPNPKRQSTQIPDLCQRKRHRPFNIRTNTPNQQPNLHQPKYLLPNDVYIFPLVVQHNPLHLPPSPSPPSNPLPSSSSSRPSTLLPAPIPIPPKNPCPTLPLLNPSLLGTGGG